MPESALIDEIRTLLKDDSSISQKVFARLSLAAIAEVLTRTDAICDDMVALDGRVDRLETKHDGLDKRVNGWSITNSLGVVAAGVLAFFRGS